jgi:hypothetical protein
MERTMNFDLNRSLRRKRHLRLHRQQQVEVGKWRKRGVSSVRADGRFWDAARHHSATDMRREADIKHAQCC